MSTRFRVQTLDGVVRPTIPNGYESTTPTIPAGGFRGADCPYLFNVFIGDSNMVGTDAPWSDDLAELLPAYAQGEYSGADFELRGALMSGNWYKATDRNSLSLDRTVGRNGSLLPGTSHLYIPVTKDLGAHPVGEAAPDDGTTDPTWSAIAGLLPWYRENLDPGLSDLTVAASDIGAPGAGASDTGSQQGGVINLKYAANGAQPGRKITARRYFDGSFAEPGSPGTYAAAPEFLSQETVASFHPDSNGDGANGSLFSNLQGTINFYRGVYAGRGRAFFDCLYVNMFSASGKHLGNSQMLSDFTAFYDDLMAGFANFPSNKTPNMIIVEPQIGAFELDRQRQLQDAFGRIKARFRNAAFVNVNDLAMNGDNHFTSASYIEIGNRMARARQGLPDAVIYEI